MILSNVLSTLAAMGLETLREQLALALIANRDYEPLFRGAQKYSTVNVTIPAAVAATDVTPANVPPATADQTPTIVPITLDAWKEAAFTMNDKDFQQVDAGIIPMQASEAVKAIANAIETYLWTKANFYTIYGTPGTTPLAADHDEYLQTRARANLELMPPGNRWMVVDTFAEANALALRGFQDASFGGGDTVITEGVLGRKLGANWIMSQLVPTQLIGTHNGAYVVNGVHALGVKAILVSTGTGTIKAGEIITFSGDLQTYAVQADYAGGAGTISVEPGLRVAKSGAETLTFHTAFVKNALIHPSAISFAMAPLAETNPAPNLAAFQPIVDPLSGLALRVELTREHKRWRWSYDALWGGALTRPPLGAIMAG